MDSEIAYKNGIDTEFSSAYAVFVFICHHFPDVEKMVIYPHSECHLKLFNMTRLIRTEAG